ncbi:phosphopantetheine-binding protein [Kitasatospora sp. NPDC058063]|uniref:phosphopantetheine-binding protein n=1 Tax=unclassified Kitasatospora TaxID=2633591 RepID=UPI0036D9C7CB
MLEELPISANGKLDRRRLPAPQERSAAADRPLGPVEEAVHALWCEVLELPEVGATRSFFDLGGHSLIAVRLLNEVRERLELQLPLATFFRTPTIRGLARGATPVGRAVHGSGPDPATAFEPTAVEALRVEAAPVPEQAAVETAPATSAQRRLWRRHREHGVPAVHNMCLRVDLTGRPMGVKGSQVQILSSRQECRSPADWTEVQASGAFAVSAAGSANEPQVATGGVRRGHFGTRGPAGAAQMRTQRLACQLDCAPIRV